MLGKIYKFPLDKKTFQSKEQLYNHIEKNYSNLLSEDMPASRLYFNLKYNKTEGKSVISGKPTKWNSITERYERFVNEDEKRIYIKQFQDRMMNKYGKTHLTVDPEQQMKMLEAKKNSFDYVWNDGSKTKCISTYESDFLSYLEGNYLFKEDYLMRAPVIYYSVDNNFKPDNNILSKLKNIKDVKLFGSRLHGNYNKNSDVDIAFIIHPEKDKHDIETSSLIPHNKNEFAKKLLEVQSALGINPDTNKPYVIDLVGLYELRFFNKNIFDTSKIRFYLPDFYIPSINLIIEIKGNNNHYQKRDYEYEVLKEKATRSLGFAYVKIIDKDYNNFDSFLDSIN